MGLLKQSRAQKHFQHFLPNGVSDPDFVSQLLLYCLVQDHTDMDKKTKRKRLSSITGWINRHYLFHLVTYYKLAHAYLL